MSYLHVLPTNPGLWFYNVRCSLVLGSLSLKLLKLLKTEFLIKETSYKNTIVKKKMLFSQSFSPSTHFISVLLMLTLVHRSWLEVSIGKWRTPKRSRRSGIYSLYQFILRSIEPPFISLLLIFQKIIAKFNRTQTKLFPPQWPRP